MPTELDRYRDAVNLSLGQTGPPTCPSCGTTEGSLGTAGAYFICRGPCAVDGLSTERYWTPDRKPAAEWIESLKASPWGRKTELTDLLVEQIKIQQATIDRVKADGDRDFRAANIETEQQSNEADQLAEDLKEARQEIQSLRATMEADIVELREERDAARTDVERLRMLAELRRGQIEAGKLEIESLKATGRGLTPGLDDSLDRVGPTCGRQTWCVLLDGHDEDCRHSLDPRVPSGEPKPVRDVACPMCGKLSIWDLKAQAYRCQGCRTCFGREVAPSPKGEHPASPLARSASGGGAMADAIKLARDAIDKELGMDGLQAKDRPGTRARIIEIRDRLDDAIEAASAAPEGKDTITLKIDRIVADGMLQKVIQSMEQRLREEHGTLDANVMNLKESCAQTYQILEWLTTLRAVPSAGGDGTANANEISRELGVDHATFPKPAGEIEVMIERYVEALKGGYKPNIDSYLDLLDDDSLRADARRHLELARNLHATKPDPEATTDDLRRVLHMMEILRAVAAESERAVREHGEFNSIHEAAAIIREEYDELWEIVRQKRAIRRPAEIRHECIQIAAAAVKCALTFGTVQPLSDMNDSVDIDLAEGETLEDALGMVARVSGVPRHHDAAMADDKGMDGRGWHCPRKYGGTHKGHDYSNQQDGSIRCHHCNALKDETLGQAVGTEPERKPWTCQWCPDEEFETHKDLARHMLHGPHKREPEPKQPEHSDAAVDAKVCERNQWCIREEGHPDGCWPNVDPSHLGDSPSVEDVAENYLDGLHAKASPDMDSLLKLLPSDQQAEGRRRMELVQILYRAGQAPRGPARLGETMVLGDPVHCPVCRSWHQPPECEGGS